MSAVETDSGSKRKNLMLYLFSVVFVLFTTCFKVTYQAAIRWVKEQHQQSSPTLWVKRFNTDQDYQIVIKLIKYHEEKIPYITDTYKENTENIDINNKTELTELTKLNIFSTFLNKLHNYMFKKLKINLIT